MTMHFARSIQTLLFLLLIQVSVADGSPYQPTQASVCTHPMPEWYQDAKFGVMIHYGLYSVPAWAPIFNPVGKLFTPEFFINNPYSEWYLNTMQIEGSPTYQHHLKTYGAHYSYDNFVPQFNRALRYWKPDQWSQLFSAAGAKNVVFVSKHADGFLMWPSHFTNPYKQNYVANRDVVGELTQSVRKHKMRMGLYYSGGYDWTFPTVAEPITNIKSAIQKVPQTQEYADYVTHQWQELIELYHPDLLWNDIALPGKIDKFKLLADYYNTMSEGVVNNRWGQGRLDFSAFGQPTDVQLDLQMKFDWFDYFSPEYLAQYTMRKHKWEADHGPGYSFGYNREEFAHPEHFLSLDQLIAELADIVSKNGNLLLAISPDAFGNIPKLERDLLQGMGLWLKANGEAIFATRPWGIAEGTANAGTLPLRFTVDKEGKSLYVIILKNPDNQDVVLQNFLIRDPNTIIEVLNKGSARRIAWHNQLNDSVVELSQSDSPRKHPIVLRISPIPVL